MVLQDAKMCGNKVIILPNEPRLIHYPAIGQYQLGSALAPLDPEKNKRFQIMDGWIITSLLSLSWFHMARSHCWWTQIQMAEVVFLW